MTTPTQKLVTLLEQFPIIKYLDYENHGHRLFLNGLLLALKDAAPELRAFASSQAPLPDQPSDTNHPIILDSEGTPISSSPTPSPFPPRKRKTT